MKIKNVEDLRRERKRLKAELAESEANLKDHWEYAKEQLNPVRTAGRFIGNAMVHKNDGVIDKTMRLAIDKILKGLVLSKSGWITRTIVSYMVKNMSSNMLAEKRPELLNKIKGFIHQARNVTNNKARHYDRSTAGQVNF